MATNITITTPAGSVTTITSPNPTVQNTDTHYTVPAPYTIQPGLPTNPFLFRGATANINGVDHSGTNPTNPGIAVTENQGNFVDVRIN